MIYEKLKIQFDVQKLAEHLKTHVLHLPPATQSEAFGGWSVLSKTGSYLDGWTPGHKVFYKSQVNTMQEVSAELQKIGWTKPSEHVNPTEICHGYLYQVIREIDDLGLKPRRARIIRLKAESQSALHRDALEGMYMIRLHVPIITNPGCFFVCEEGAAHLPADGSAYILSVSRMHKVVNEGTEDRFHLVIDVTDSQGLTQHHRLPDAQPTV